MTTKVVKGSAWTFASQIVPMLVSFVSTPFIIRFLGSESYGVLILIGLIPNYFSFADFGMGIASTNFGSDAFARGDLQGEAEAVRTSLAFALCTSLIVALPVFIFAPQILTTFNVPTELLGEAIPALRVTSIGFVVGIAGSVLNTPQLTRLRMDLSAMIGVSNRLLVSILTPLVLYLGGGLLEAALVALVVAAGGLLSHLIVSRRLLNELWGLKLAPPLVRPLLKFGVGLVIAGLAGILLANFEKAAISKLVSVQSLAYYSVAFTLASTATMLSSAMVQSLVPAFAQLLQSPDRNRFEVLFRRCVRINVVGILPMLVVMYVVAAPFFGLWAGPEFAQESTGPFHVLLLGLLFNLVAYIPHSSITASGRTDALAIIYWAELPFYVVTATVLIYYYGILGAALAWTVRVAVDAGIVIRISSKITGISFAFFRDLVPVLLSGSILILPLIFYSSIESVPVQMIVTAASIAVYLFLIWRFSLPGDEREWILQRRSFALGKVIASFR
jgi:O-antigen/teichoic acid export membrane protein